MQKSKTWSKENRDVDRHIKSLFKHHNLMVFLKLFCEVFVAKLNLSRQSVAASFQRTNRYRPSDVVVYMTAAFSEIPLHAIFVSLIWCDENSIQNMENVLLSWCMVHGAWCMVYGAWCMVHFSWMLLKNFRIPRKNASYFQNTKVRSLKFQI